MYGQSVLEFSRLWSSQEQISPPVNLPITERQCTRDSRASLCSSDQTRRLVGTIHNGHCQKPGPFQGTVTGLMVIMYRLHFNRLKLVIKKGTSTL